MGQGHSVQDMGVQRSKSRYSTRSLPDNSKLRRSSSSNKNATGPVGKSSSGNNGVAQHGVYVGDQSSTTADLNDSKTASEIWWKDAAPYYSAPAAKYRPGPRSLDIGYGRSGDVAPYHKAYSEVQYAQGRGGDAAWSDVASDVYRTRDKSKDSRRSRRQKPASESGSAYYDCVSERSHKQHKSNGRSHGMPIAEVIDDLEALETQSDVFYNASAELKQRESRNSKEKGSRVREHLSLQSAPLERKSKNIIVSQDMSPARPKRLSSRTRQNPPPRPPKSPGQKDAGEAPVSSTAVPGEQWVDFPPSQIRDTDSKVTFDEKQFLHTKQEVPITPPKSPGSVECDKLIIQSMRTELAEERTLRVEAEERAASASKKSAQMENKVVEMSNQLSNLTKLSDNSSEKRIRALEARLADSDEKMRHLTMEKEQYQVAYGKCLDDIAKSVARALMQQKSLKSECLRLQKRVMEVEWEKKVLQAQLQLAGLSSPTTVMESRASNNNETPLRIRAPLTNGSAAKRNKYRQSMGSDPTLQLSGGPENGGFCLSESLASITSQNFLMSNQDTSSPLSNGGEGLCSRPQSFSFDLSATSSLNQLSFSQQALIRAQQQNPTGANNFPPRLGNEANLYPRAQFRKPSMPPPMKLTSNLTTTGVLNRFPASFGPPQQSFGSKLKSAAPNFNSGFNGCMVSNQKPRISAKVSPLDRLKDLEKEDLFGDDCDNDEKPRNFGQVESGTQGFTDFYSSSTSGKPQQKNSEPVPFKKPQPVPVLHCERQGMVVGNQQAGSLRGDLNLSGGSSVVEKMRGAGHSGSSINSLAFLGSVLNGEDNKEFHSTPKTSPHKANLSGASDEGSTTPTLSETAFSSAHGQDIDEELDRAVTPMSNRESPCPPEKKKEELTIAYVDTLIQPKSVEVITRKQRCTAIVNPTRHLDDGYSSLSGPEGDLKKQKEGESVVYYENVWAQTDKSTTTERLEWDQLVMMQAKTAILTSSCTSSATRSTSSGFGSDTARITGEREESVCNEYDQEYATNDQLTARRWSSDSNLYIKTSKWSRIGKMIEILMASQRESECWGSEGIGIREFGRRSKWHSCAELTELERNLLNGQPGTFVDANSIDDISVGENREGLFDLTDANDVDVEEINRAFRSIEALASDMEKESLCQFNDSFYALCSKSPQSDELGKSLNVKVENREGDIGPLSPNSESTSNDDSLSPRGRMFMDEVAASTSSTSSYTSEDSEDDGAATVQAWLKQLKRKPTRDRNAIPCVRYSPKGSRKSILKPRIFTRFGQPERSALATFDFLQDHPTDVSCSSASPEGAARNKQTIAEGGVKLRKKRAKSDRNEVESKRMSQSLNDFGELLTEESKWRRRRRKAGSSVSSLRSNESYSSSLFLSDLCNANVSLSSSSSLSLQ